MDNIYFLIKVIIMGIVEGVTEFLPISSSGHMIIIGYFIKFDGSTYNEAFVNMFEVVIQLGAILAIVVLYWDKIKKSLQTLLPVGNSGFKLWLNILIAFMPSAVIGLLVHKKVNLYLFKPLPVACAMVVGGLLLIFIENKYRKQSTTKSIDNVSIKQSVLVGCFQCLSLWPGMSRSASTIMGAWIGGLSNVAAAEFSFFLAIPTMVAASFLELIKTDFSKISSLEIIGLGIGFIVAFIVALLVVEKFVNFLKKKSMRVFAVYRILIGLVLLVLAFAKVIVL